MIQLIHLLGSMLSLLSKYLLISYLEHQFLRVLSEQVSETFFSHINYLARIPANFFLFKTKTFASYDHAQLETVVFGTQLFVFQSPIFQNTIILIFDQIQESNQTSVLTLFSSTYHLKFDLQYQYLNDFGLVFPCYMFALASCGQKQYSVVV